MKLAREHNAALIALTIDENGMAKTAEEKLAVAKRIYRLALDEFGFKPQDLVFDPLTFTLASGSTETLDAGIQTLDAIRAIKRELPGVFTSLGLSNISFGLNPPARAVLNTGHAVSRRTGWFGHGHPQPSPIQSLQCVGRTPKNN